MSKDKIVSGRQALHDKKDPGEKIDPVPTEIPLGTRKLPSVAQEIQAQIAMAIAKKNPGS